MNTSISSDFISAMSFPYLVITISSSHSRRSRLSRTAFGMTICHFAFMVTDPYIFTSASSFLDIGYIEK
jgi:hypothetical protein